MMKNISLSVNGVNVAFDEDGTMRYIAMKIVNMDQDNKWQEVSASICAIFFTKTVRLCSFAVVGVGIKSSTHRSEFACVCCV